MKNPLFRFINPNHEKILLAALPTPKKSVFERALFVSAINHFVGKIVVWSVKTMAHGVRACKQFGIFSLGSRKLIESEMENMFSWKFQMWNPWRKFTSWAGARMQFVNSILCFFKFETSQWTWIVQMPWWCRSARTPLQGGCVPHWRVLVINQKAHCSLQRVASFCFVFVAAWVTTRSQSRSWHCPWARVRSRWLGACVDLQLCMDPTAAGPFCSTPRGRGRPSAVALPLSSAAQGQRRVWSRRCKKSKKMARIWTKVLLENSFKESVFKQRHFRSVAKQILGSLRLDVDLKARRILLGR